MTDLTEQLYDGNLPTGHYYFNNGVETYIVLYSNINTKDRKLQEPEGLTVLSKVPSYEEHTKLKELLKECDRMNTNLQNALWQWNEESDLYEECDALEAKINQELGEDK